MILALRVFKAQVAIRLNTEFVLVVIIVMAVVVVVALFVPALACESAYVY